MPFLGWRQEVVATHCLVPGGWVSWACCLPSLGGGVASCSVQALVWSGRWTALHATCLPPTSTYRFQHCSWWEGGCSAECHLATHVYMYSPFTFCLLGGALPFSAYASGYNAVQLARGAVRGDGGVIMLKRTAVSLLRSGRYSCLYFRGTDV
jgi:hypothetical protein